MFDIDPTFLGPDDLEDRHFNQIVLRKVGVFPMMVRYCWYNNELLVRGIEIYSHPLCRLEHLLADDVPFEKLPEVAKDAIDAEIRAWERERKEAAEQRRALSPEDIASGALAELLL